MQKFPKRKIILNHLNLFCNLSFMPSVCAVIRILARFSSQKFQLFEKIVEKNARHSINLFSI
jgi:hypothetical protein